MQVELLNDRLESYTAPKIGTVLKWGEDITIVVEKGKVKTWSTNMLAVKPSVDKGSSEETNRLLSTIADHLEIIAEELQEISGRMG
jgi:hypothetical protein